MLLFKCQESSLLALFFNFWSFTFVNGGPLNLDLVRGETVKLSCTIPFGLTCSQVVWIRTPLSGQPEHTEYISSCDVFYPGFFAPWITRGKIGVSRQGINVILTVNHVEPADAMYVYTCQDYRYKVLETFQLTLHQPRCSSNVNLSMESSAIKVQLNCSIGSSTLLKWYSPTGVLLSSNIDTIHRMLSTEVVLRKNHNYERFRCSAGYNQDVTQNWCDVRPLQVPPSVDISPSVAYATIGDNVTLKCVPNIGFPSLEYKWLVNQKAIPDGMRSKYREDGDTLTVMNVTLLDGGVVFKCKAENVLGIKTGSKKAILYVRDNSYTETTTEETFIETTEISEGSAYNATATRMLTEMTTTRSSTDGKPSKIIDQETGGSFGGSKNQTEKIVKGIDVTVVDEQRKNNLGKRSKASAIIFVCLGISLISVVIVILTVILLGLLIKRQSLQKQTVGDGDKTVTMSEMQPDGNDVKEVEFTIRLSPFVSRGPLQAAVINVENDDQDKDKKKDDDVLYSLPLAKHLRKPKRASVKNTGYANMDFQNSETSKTNSEGKEACHVAKGNVYSNMTEGVMTENVSIENQKSEHVADKDTEKKKHASKPSL